MPLGYSIFLNVILIESIYKGVGTSLKAHPVSMHFQLLFDSSLKIFPKYSLSLTALYPVVQDTWNFPTTPCPPVPGSIYYLYHITTLENMTQTSLSNGSNDPLSVFLVGKDHILSESFVSRLEPSHYSTRTRPDIKE